MMKILIGLYLFLALACLSCCSGHECSDDDHFHTYQCKDISEETRDLSCQCSHFEDEVQYNCTCYSQQDDDDSPYLNCMDALNKGQNKSGVYDIKPNDLLSFNVYCDMETDGGGWTVFQRRKDGSVYFNRNWEDYVHGFGSLTGEFWLGLSKIYRLANSSDSATLRMDMEDYTNIETYARFSNFYLGSYFTEYKLSISGYVGNAAAGDRMSYHNGYRFSTVDNDNDDRGGSNCAQSFGGGWWHRNCFYANLNAPYSSSYFRWNTKRLVFTEMKLR